MALSGCFNLILGCMEGAWLENANILSVIPVSSRLLTRRSNFLNFHKRLITYYALIGQLASRRVRRI